MDTKSWVSALELFLQYPLLLIVTFVIACAAAGFAWWLRGHLAQSKLDLAQAKLNAQETRHALRECDVPLGTRTTFERLTDQHRTPNNA
jgi:hypothetical protein